MRVGYYRALLLALLPLLAAVLAGCGSTGGGPAAGTLVTVKGKLLKNKKPVSGMVITQLVQAGSTGMINGAVNGTDGSARFEGVVPGSYKLSVVVSDSKGRSPGGASPIGPSGSSPSFEGTGPTSYFPTPSPSDTLKGRFAGEQSPISITVPKDQTEYDFGTIDLDDQTTWNK